MLTFDKWFVCTWFVNVVFADPYSEPPTYSCEPLVPPVLLLKQSQYTSYFPAVLHVRLAIFVYVLDVARDVLCATWTFFELPPAAIV